MELAIVIYLVEILEKISNFNGIGLILTIGLLVAAFCALSGAALAIGEAEQETIEGYFKSLFNYGKKPAKVFVIAALIGHGFAFFMPTKETSYTMLAAYGVQTVAQSEQVTTVLGKSSQVLEKYMNQYLEDKNEEVVEETSE